MSGVQRQPGDHVLVEALVVGGLDEDGDYEISTQNAGDDRGEDPTWISVRAADVRSVSVAPAPDTGGWTAEREGVYITASNPALPALTFEAPDSWPDDRLSCDEEAQAAVLALRVREREEAARTAPAPVDDAPCACWPTPESDWTTHYGAVEPGSTMEHNPDCPVHGIAPAPVADERLAVALVAWEKHWDVIGMPLDSDRADGMRAVLAALDAQGSGTTP